MVKSDKNAKNRRRDVFTASKIQRLIRRALALQADFLADKFSAAEGSTGEKCCNWGHCLQKMFECRGYM